MVRLEWSALKCEGEALASRGREGREAAREAREHRRLLDRLQIDFVRSLRRAASKEAQEPILDPLSYFRFLEAGER